MKRILITTLFFASAALAQTPAATDAIAALRGIKAATEIGTNVREYRTRVIDAKAKVDEYVDAAAKDDPQAKFIAATMRMYVLAAKAWGGGDYAAFLEVGKAVMEEPGIADTPGLAAAWPKWLEGTEKTDTDRYSRIGAAISIKPGFLWRYAAIKLDSLKK